MVNGIYSVAFVGPSQATGTGVCYIEDGTIRGGDAAYAYFGTFTSAEGKVTALLQIVQHKQGGQSVFGPLKNFKLDFNGSVDGDRFNLAGLIPGQPNMTLNVRGYKVQNLT